MAGEPNTLLGYFTLSAAVKILEQDQGWQNGSPHTLSVLDLNSDGYQYWGWYGSPVMTGGPIGIVRSNDLTTWDQHPSNPIIASGRWPSVVKVGNTFYMALTKYNTLTTNEYIQLLTSADGVSWSVIETICPENSGHYVDNPYLFINPNDNLVYLYFTDADLSTGASIIYCRIATDINDLATATPIIVMQTPGTIAPLNIAAPSMMYYNGEYFLCVEYTMASGLWGTLAYSSSNPTSGFIQLPNSPILTNDEPCFFQFKFGNIVFCPNARRVGGVGGTWQLDMRTIDLTQTRPQA